MKLLFDENLSFKLCRQLDDLFPGSSQVQLLGLERADDATIRGHAKANEFAIVTLDADFVEMAALLGSPPKVIRPLRQSGDDLHRDAFAAQRRNNWQFRARSIRLLGNLLAPQRQKKFTRRFCARSPVPKQRRLQRQAVTAKTADDLHAEW